MGAASETCVLAEVCHHALLDLTCCIKELGNCNHQFILRVEDRAASDMMQGMLGRSFKQQHMMEVLLEGSLASAYNGELTIWQV